MEREDAVCRRRGRTCVCVGDSLGRGRQSEESERARLAFINRFDVGNGSQNGLKAELVCAVGGTCCVLYAARVTMPRGHYAEATRRYTTM